MYFIYKRNFICMLLLSTRAVNHLEKRDLLVYTFEELCYILTENLIGKARGAVAETSGRIPEYPHYLIWITPA